MVKKKYLGTYPCNKEALPVVQHRFFQQALLGLTLKRAIGTLVLIYKMANVYTYIYIYESS